MPFTVNCEPVLSIKSISKNCHVKKNPGDHCHNWQDMHQHRLLFLFCMLYVLASTQMDSTGSCHAADWLAGVMPLVRCAVSDGFAIAPADTSSGCYVADIYRAITAGTRVPVTTVTETGFFVLPQGGWHDDCIPCLCVNLCGQHSLSLFTAEAALPFIVRAGGQVATANE